MEAFAGAEETGEEILMSQRFWLVVVCVFDLCFLANGVYAIINPAKWHRSWMLGKKQQYSIGNLRLLRIFGVFCLIVGILLLVNLAANFTLYWNDGT